jgi:hypothetical protein
MTPCFTTRTLWNSRYLLAEHPADGPHTAATGKLILGFGSTASWMPFMKPQKK